VPHVRAARFAARLMLATPGYAGPHRAPYAGHVAHEEHSGTRGAAAGRISNADARTLRIYVQVADGKHVELLEACRLVGLPSAHEGARRPGVGAAGRGDRVSGDGVRGVSHHLRSVPREIRCDRRVSRLGEENAERS